MLDWQVCSRARLSRDARFDGKFYIGVRTSGVYCRPICPARTAKECNVRYFPSAAAAAEAGFRPCLRCRPESSPGTPAWLGTSSTVSRALRLIAEGALEERDMEALADQLGIGSRHLRRLFLQYLGATPSTVAQTRRLQFAKKLIDETALPMTQLALASGFGCVRRFNAAIRKTYHRTPSQLRHLAHNLEPGAENQYLFRLHFRPPYDWEHMLASLAADAVPGVEVVVNGMYRRSIAIGGGRGFLEVACEPGDHWLRVRIQFDRPQQLLVIIERVRAMFDLNADWQSIAKGLRASALLADIVRLQPGRRVPGCWSGFELATRAVLGQRGSPARAARFASRIVQALGAPFAACAGLTHLFPTPEAMAEANLGLLGLPQHRALSLQTLARWVRDGQLRIARDVDTAVFLNRFGQLPGIDPQTAQYVAMRGLGDPDAFPVLPSSDRRAAEARRTSGLEKAAEACRPWRAYASMYLPPEH